MTAEERMRERAAQWCRDFASSRTIHNTTFPDTAARSALQLEQAIRALPLEGEQGEPDFRTPEERKFCDQLAADAAQDQRGATSHEVTGPRDRAAESAPHHSRAEQEPTEAVRVTTSGGGPAPAREPVPYDGVANKAQYEAECAHAEQAAREPAVEEVKAARKQGQFNAGNDIYWQNAIGVDLALRHAEELDRLRADAENFHMAYRMKCDKETKAQAVEIDRLRAENAALREQLKVLRGMTQAALNAASAAHRGDEEWATINELQSMLAAAKEPK